MIQAAVLGFGTVGSGVVGLLDKNSEIVRRSVPEGINVKYILDLREFPDSPYRDKVIHDINIILNDPEIKLVCEVMGGKEPAFSFSKSFLEKGVSVCTSNKELVAARGPELLEIARAHNCSYLFEASVGGGIPLLRTIMSGLPQEDITEVVGILNGTTNYILTKMDRYGADFDSVLKEAQEKGYAERNPAADIEGHDTGRKIAILSSIIGGATVEYEDIYVEGITKVTPKDFACAKALDSEVKLLGVMKKKESGELEVLTAPFLVPNENPLAPVSDVFNGILLHGTMVDDVMLYGRGAGKDPTASAVVSDVIDCATHIGSTAHIPWDGSKKLTIEDHALREGRFLVRVPAAEEALARELFADVQKVDTGLTDEFAFVTGTVTEAEFSEKAAKLTIANRIRLL